MSDKHPKHPDAPQEDNERAVPKDKGKEKPSGEKKNKRASVYLYLVILFGAAFMMLLLAYFVQQRNNESTISDLQDTMNLSRGELMAEIDQIKQEKAELESALDALTAEQEKTDEELSRLQDAHAQLTQDYSAVCQRQELAGSLAWLERFCAQGDWLMAAAVVEDSEALFNEQAAGYDRDREVLPSPVQAARYLQLAEETYKKSRCMVTVTQNEDNPEQRMEERQIAEDGGAYNSQAIAAARTLWDILRSHQSGDLAEAARLTAELYADDGPRRALSSSAFRASTSAALEQILQELTGAGYLAESQDGTFTVCPPASSSAPGSAGEETPAQE